MGLNRYRNEAGSFLAHWDHDLWEALEAEFELLKTSVDDPDAFRHQAYDMLFLLFEMASRFNMDLDMEWNRGREKKREKYGWRMPVE